MNLLPIAKKLETDGLGVMGQTLFIGMIPADCLSGLLLRDKLTGTKIDHELPGYYKTSFQLIARSPNMLTGQTLIKSAVDAITLAETQLDDMLVRYMRPQTLPSVFPLSDGNLYEFNVWIDIAFVVS